VRAIIQRVARARVTVEGREVGAINGGLAVLLGIATDDARTDAERLLDKVLHLRIFENEEGKFDRSVCDTGGELLVISQFTLLADTTKGRRPSFSHAAPPTHAVPLYEHFVAAARAGGVRVATGTFGARMQVELTNDGPVTIMLDSKHP
jgi:D-tyrosyl-tRNA(Tyr) deacylase